jgi:hypothetical protein
VDITTSMASLSSLLWSPRNPCSPWISSIRKCRVMLSPQRS